MINLRSGGSVRLLLAVLILLMPTLAVARTINVSPGDKSGIAGALTSASFGDVVLVGCGLYWEQGLVMPDGVTLTGSVAGGCEVFIYSAGGDPVFICEDVGDLTRIENINVGFLDGTDVSRGGGAYLMNASPVFENCTFYAIPADYGGAVYCGEGSAPLFTGCRFENNYARATGGAVACVGTAAPVFNQCLFANNTAEAAGGTINAALGAAPFLIRCTVVGGDGAVGSGLSTWDLATPTLHRVIIVDGVTGRAWDGDSYSSPTPGCTDIHGNEGGDWVGALGPFESINGNISADPQFCGGHDGLNPYTLNATSPCTATANPPCGLIGAFDINCNFLSDVEEDTGGLPAVSKLYSNYPNPFNPRTTIKFDVNRAGPVELAVFDVAGRLIQRLVSETMPAGNHEAVWEGKDNRGRPASAGVYFFRLKTEDTIDTKRMTLIK